MNSHDAPLHPGGAAVPEAYCLANTSREFPETGFFQGVAMKNRFRLFTPAGYYRSPLSESQRIAGMCRLTLAMFLALLSALEAKSTGHVGMILIPGGEFTMGSNAPEAFPNEKPPHRVRVAPFFLDPYPVTNAEFARFVKATGYKTLAERPVDWDELKKQLPPGTPRPRADVLQPGALVFHLTGGPVDLKDMSQWWAWTSGASWKHPEGPGSSISGRENHPVVQVAWEDAQAYAKWSGKRLPTEAEWEFASRGGLDGKRYAWGDEESPAGRIMLNRWTGNFPCFNDQGDGFAGTSPVGSFPANGYGLFDMGGNVWNWCSDIYRADTFASRTKDQGLCCDPKGPLTTSDEITIIGDPSPPTVPGAERRVTKGGSFLCHPDYCESYRPSARRGTTPDTATSHIGFRCASDAGEARGNH